MIVLGFWGRAGPLLAALGAMLLGGAATAQTALPATPVPYPQLQARAAPPAARPASATPPRAAGPTTAAPVAAAELEAFVDGWMTDAMRRDHIPGATVSIVQNGQVILKKGYGFADISAGRRVDPDRTLFRIGSISKTFTWILLMKEVEARRIRLDRPVNLYLPDKVRLPGTSRDVLVRHLLDHSAGFEDRALGHLFENNSRRVRPLDLYLRQERPSQARAAGLLSSYSNYGAALAGEAVAFVGGKTFERRVEDEIAMPLGMNHTTFREPRNERRGLPAAMPERLRGDIAKGYGWRNAGWVANDYEFIGQAAPAGSASSTAGDMSRYMLMLLGDGRLDATSIFGPLAARAFRTPLRATPPGINGWAHGFMTFDLPGGHKGYGHWGDTLAFHSNMTLVPAMNLGVFVSTNGEDGRDLAVGLPAAVLRHLNSAPTNAYRPGQSALTEAARMFEGDYLTTRRAKGGLEGFVTLLNGGVKVMVTSGGRLITTRNGHSEAWTLEGPASDGRFISTTSDERLAFQVRDSRADSFLTGSHAEVLQRAEGVNSPVLMTSLAALTAFAAMATLAGAARRNRRELRQNQIQARAGMVQTLQAGLWVGAMVLFALWVSRASDVQAIMYRWPGALLVAASACALVAAALTIVTIAAAPGIWQGGRRVESWTGARKAFFTTTVLIYAAFSVLLALHGALEPWSR